MSVKAERERVFVPPHLVSLHGFKNKTPLTSPRCPHYCLSAPEPAGNLLTFQGNVELGVKESRVGVMEHVREVKRERKE